MLYAIVADIEGSGHMFDGGWGDAWGTVMVVAMIVFWALVILGGIWIVRSIIQSKGKAELREGPIEILDRRFAEGQIDEDEYEKRRSVIESRTELGR